MLCQFKIYLNLTFSHCQKVCHKKAAICAKTFSYDCKDTLWCQSPEGRILKVKICSSLKVIALIVLGEEIFAGFFLFFGKE